MGGPAPRGDRTSGRRRRCSATGSSTVTPAELEELDRRIGDLLEPYVRRLADREAQPDGARPVTFIQLGFPMVEDPPPS